MGEIMDLWNEYPNFPILGAHLWTIVDMFRAAMHLYMILLALAFCKEWARIFILLLLCYVYAYLEHQQIHVAFFGGAILAQLDIQRRRKDGAQHRPAHLHQDDNVTSETNNSSPSADLNGEFALPTHSSPSRYFSAFGRFLRHCVLPGLSHQRPSDGFRFVIYVLALYLMSFPLLGGRFPSLAHKPLIPLFPSGYDDMRSSFFPVQLGVFIFCWLLLTMPEQQRAKSVWHRLLTSGFCRYLGSVMFALYLVHPTVQAIYGFPLPHLIWRQWNAESKEWDYAVPEDMGTYLFGLFVGWAGAFTITLWVSDVWTREVEERCMRLTKWLEQLLFIKA